VEFTGFPSAALDFYDDLEVDNTKSFWDEHRHVYDECVRAPMLALTEALGREFGEATVFRPYRDVRFAKDKTPYKTHQGAFVRVADAPGWDVELSPRGVRTGGGFYRAEAPRLAALRRSIADETRGAELEKIIRALERKGFSVGGDVLKTAPRGYDKSHPRIDLLRHKSIIASRSIGFDPVIHSADLVGVLRKDWRATRPLVEWSVAHGAH
jgi:uncharacterized protein (TIGR02453 family)